MAANEFNLNSQVTVVIENSTLAKLVLTAVVIFILFFLVKKALNK